MMLELRGSIRFDGLEKKIMDAVLRGVGLGNEAILTESNRIIPHEEGFLEKSGQTLVTNLGFSTVEGSVFYTSVYAARQHEELTWRHDEGREAKFLEKAMNRMKTTVTDAVAEQIRRTL